MFLGHERSSSGGGGSQNLWSTFTADSGNTTANSTTDNLTVTGGTGISTSIVGDTLTISATGGGTGTMTTVKEAGVQLGGADIVTLDFGAGFDLTETPDTEINIALDFSEVAGHDNFTDYVANEHIDWTGDAGASNIHVNNITAVPESAVTAHQAALTITESQISDLAHITQEQVEDWAGAMFSTNTETGITATYQDSDGTIDLVVSDLTVAGDSGSTGMTPGDTLTIAGGAGVTTAMSGDTLTITATGGGSGTMSTIKEGGVQLGGADIVTLDFDGDDFNLTETPDTEVNITINDGGIDHDSLLNFDANEHFTQSNITTTGTVTSGVWNSTFGATANEAIEDLVGAMVTGNTETGIAVTYQDADGTFDFVVSDLTVAGDTGSTGMTPGDTLTIAGGTGISTAMSGDTLTITNDSPQLTTEEVQDIAGALVATGGTKTGITITYQDGTNDMDFVVDSASDSQQGIVELATIAETDTGTDATRAITPDGLAGSEFGERAVQVVVFEWATDVATGDGKYYFHIDSRIAGMNLVDVHAEVITAGTTGTTDIQIHNVTQTADMLSTKLTIDSAETGSDTAATAAVIDTANDDVAENDLLRIDVDAVSTTAPQGLIITMGFRLP
jgi:hypothetical protein